MKTKVRAFWFTLAAIYVLAILPAAAQSFLIKGKVTDAETGDPVPFAGVKLKGKKASAITNFDGYFQITTTDISDSLVCSYVGYKSRTKALRKVENQTVNFQLKSEGLTTKDVVIMAGENPAWEIMRRTIDNKRKNNMAKLTAYEYDSYTKIEVDVDNLSEKFKKRKVVKQIQAVMDSIQVMAGDEGQPVLPVFISESISKIYYRKNPQAQREEIKNTRTVGIGLEDG
ncbi:MAG: carboxypeptidase-like regulatory domain-containing protein, partial [Flexibacteraceae bacterium]